MGGKVLQGGFASVQSKLERWFGGASLWWVELAFGVSDLGTDGIKITQCFSSLWVIVSMAIHVPDSTAG